MFLKLNHAAGFFGLAFLVFPIAWSIGGEETEEENEVEAPEAPEQLGQSLGAPVLAGEIDVPLQDAIYRSGLTPEALAAARVTAGQLETMCQAVKNDLDSVQPILDGADSGVAQGRTDVGRLKRLVRSGKGTDSDVAALAQAKTACEAAMAEQKNCMNHFFATACAVLNESQRNSLVNIRRNKPWKAPEYYKTVVRTDLEWSLLEEYLDIERIEPKYGLEPEPEVIEFLSNVRQDPAYAAAKTAYETNLASIKNALNVAIRD